MQTFTFGSEGILILMLECDEFEKGIKDLRDFFISDFHELSKTFIENM